MLIRPTSITPRYSLRPLGLLQTAGSAQADSGGTKKTPQAVAGRNRQIDRQGGQSCRKLNPGPLVKLRRWRTRSGRTRSRKLPTTRGRATSDCISQSLRRRPAKAEFSSILYGSPGASVASNSAPLMESLPRLSFLRYAFTSQAGTLTPSKHRSRSFPWHPHNCGVGILTSSRVTSGELEQYSRN